MWILIVIIQYSLKIEDSESDRFEMCRPSVSIYLGTHLIMLEWTREQEKHTKKKQNLIKKPGLVPYKLQFYIASTIQSIF